MSTPDLQAVVDRLEIQDLISRYPVFVDDKQLDSLDGLFTADARLDFTSFGGPQAGLGEVKEFLTASLGMFASTQHMMGLPMITLNGDTATAKTSCHNPMVMEGPDGKRQAWLIGLWYDDEFAKSADGWRIASRTATRCYAVLNLNDTNLTA
ncbi:MAG TPA: nuclear transport factor 2 family protein [Mycobacteriales bacterium]|jgi:hypothetical protein|nr:nuclear transport factor 2 family protein [Mycobacteriales bacterium]